jgi:hypothetical protein
MNYIKITKIIKAEFWACWLTQQGSMIRMELHATGVLRACLKA